MMEDYNSLLAPFFGTTNDHCFTAEDKTHARDPTKGLDLVILVILAAIAVLICTGTLLDLPALIFPPTSSLAAIATSSNSLSLDLVKSFSLVSNAATLLSTKSGSGRLDSMNGMK